VSVDEFIDGLCAEAGEAMRPLLQQAYDRGFREALASAGQPAVPAPIEQPAPPAAAPIAARVEWVADPARDADDASDVEGDEGEDDSSAGETPAPRPILANAMIGTLRRRIIRTFDLERFEIDVVICRSGDPDRRQLKSSARLALYRREEG
jgi:hypothetical protein